MKFEPFPVLPIVLRCDAAVERKVRYVFDTLFLAAGIPGRFASVPPAVGPWILYAVDPSDAAESGAALFIAYRREAWEVFGEAELPARTNTVGTLPTVLPHRAGNASYRPSVDFDLVANAFYFLSSWAERRGISAGPSSRQLHSASEFARLGVPQDIVDVYLAHLIERLRFLCHRIGAPMWPPLQWPDGRSFAVVLSHDVDFIPVEPFDNAIQGVKTIARHLLRQRDPADAWRAAVGWMTATARGRDPYGCVPEIIAREREMGVRSSFQVAVGHRHPNDVNYRIQDDKVRNYLRAITDAEFDLCLHGSYRSTENPQWYLDEVELLTRRLARPRGSRQHFLSFDYDQLFATQEEAGIEYDMSIGFPDQPGPRAGFSYPYFPYNLLEDRPYRVLQISLFLMDVTLSGYLRLKAGAARRVIHECLADLCQKRGGVSVVWHPIVFGGARDPGYGSLYFDMAEQIGALGGLATDGLTVNAFWRSRASGHASFA